MERIHKNTAMGKCFCWWINDTTGRFWLLVSTAVAVLVTLFHNGAVVTEQKGTRADLPPFTDFLCCEHGHTCRLGVKVLLQRGAVWRK